MSRPVEREISDCVVCMRDGEGSSIITRAERGPSRKSPGEPADRGFVCFPCQQEEDERL